MTGGPGVEDLLRELAPQVLATLVRRYGQFHLCEDASQEALLAAALQWPADGIPENPRGWLITVASRRLMDQVRSEQSRRNREDLIAAATPQSELLGPPRPTPSLPTMTTRWPCCSAAAIPRCRPPSQIALTLRAVGGLSTAQIAAAFGVPEATMAQRISRAKQTIIQAGCRLQHARPRRSGPSGCSAVLHVLYLIFSEGYSTSDGDELTRPGAVARGDPAHPLAAPAAARGQRGGRPAGADAADRRAARRPYQPDGSLIPLAEQDRARWDQEQIAEGTALLTEALPRGAAGPYQLQAAIAALHDEAATMADTDWPQILALFRLLEALAPNPFTTLNRAVAVGHGRGTEAGLRVLDALAADKRMARHHRLIAARAHLEELAGHAQAAAEDYLLAARYATSLPERRYLAIQAARLRGAASPGTQ